MTRNFHVIQGSTIRCAIALSGSAGYSNADISRQYPSIVYAHVINAHIITDHLDLTLVP
jgi:hypothetical protein